MKVEIELSAEEISDEMDRIKKLPAETRKDELIARILKWCQDTADVEVAYVIENTDPSDVYMEKSNT